MISRKKSVAFSHMPAAPSRQPSSSSSPLLLIIVLSTWLLGTAPFVPRYVSVLSNTGSWLGTLLGFLSIVWISVVAFVAAYHVVSFVLSMITRRHPIQLSRRFDTSPPVAVLYVCLNDIDEDALESCLAQEYSNYQIFVLDDSTDNEERGRVDTISQKHPERLRVIRRESKENFKAGNLNYAIGLIGHYFKYFCIVDADEVLPPKFLWSSVAIAEGDSRIGFVQAAHLTYSRTVFGQITGDGIEQHWNYFLPVRNISGFVHFFGHGALLRASAVFEVGGFPNVVAEDLALAVRMRMAGYRGYFSHDITCYEAVAPTYNAFRRRNRRILAGTLEFLQTVYPSFFKDPAVPLTERLDVFIGACVVLLPTCFVLFLLISFFVVPLIAAAWLGSLNNIVCMLKGTFSPLYGWDFSIYVLLTILAPAVYLLPNLLESPRRTFSYMVQIATVHLSLCVALTSQTVGWLRSHRTEFVPTGDRRAIENKEAWLRIDAVWGVAFLLVAAIWGSLSLAAVGFSLVMVPLLQADASNSQLLRAALCVPFVLAILGTVSGPTAAVAATGAYIGFALSCH